MKKIILSTAIVLFISFQMQAQWFFGNKTTGNGVMKSETRNVGDFDKISISGPFNVALVKGKEGKVKIKIDENLLEYLVTEVRSGKLVIKWKKGSNIRTKKTIHIVIPFHDVEAVSLLGSGDIISDDLIKAKHFETFLSGSGDIILNVDASSVTAKVTGSGNIKLIGNSEKIEFLLTGSGGINSYKLKAKTAKVTVTGSGDIGLFASNKLNARITGSGDITYAGNPTNQNFKITGSGDIDAK